MFNSFVFAEVDSLNIFTISTSSLGVDPFAEDVLILDNHAFIADANGGVWALDISNKENPVILDNFVSGLDLYAYCITGYKYVDENNKVTYKIFVGSVQGIQGIYRFEFSGDSFHEEGIESWGETVRDFYYEKPYLYVAGDDGFRIYYADEEYFYFQSFTEVPVVKGIHIKDSFAFMVSAETDSFMHVYNISNKFKPKFVTKLKVGTNPWEVYIKGNYAYVLVSGEFLIIDITNPSNPFILSRFPLSYTQSEGRICVEENYAYMGHNNYGLEVLDISNPSSPFMVGHYYYLSKFGYGAIGTFVKDKTVYSAFERQGFKIFQFCPDGFVFDIFFSASVDYEIMDTIFTKFNKQNTNLPFREVEVYLTDINDNKLTESKYPDENGFVYFEIMKNDTFPIYIVAKNLVTTTQIEKREVKTNYKTFASIETVNELPVLKNIDYTLKVYEYGIYPPTDSLKTDLIPSVGTSVKCYDEKGIIYFDGTTNTDGIYSYLFNLKSNANLFIEVDKIGFVKEIRKITPYIWSGIGEGFGKNNQRKIVRDINSDRMHMVYSDGDSVVYGYSDNFGGIWYLEKIGEGVNPSLVKTESGLIAMWNRGTNIEYAIKSSPWSGEDSLSQPLLWSSEPVLSGSWESGNRYGAYIGNRYLNEARGDLVIFRWLDDDIENVIFDTIFGYDGRIDSIVPMYSPLVTPRYYYGYETYEAGCIDDKWRLVTKMRNLNDSTWTSKQISSKDQIVMDPSVDYDNHITTYIWEVYKGEGITEIWNDRVGKVNLTEGLNKYPVSRGAIQNSYINDYSRIIGNREGYSEEFTPLSYIVYEGIDSIHSMDVVYKRVYERRKFTTRFYYGFFEGSNGEYRFKSEEKVYDESIVLPISSGEPTETIYEVSSTPLREYVKGNFKVERLNYSVNCLNKEMSYLVRVKIDDRNPHIPEVVMIDGEVMGVVYGGKDVGEVEIVVPREKYYNDKGFLVSIDRKKGDKTREAKVDVYEYEGGLVESKGGDQVWKMKGAEEKGGERASIVEMKYDMGSGEVRYMMRGEGKVNVKVIDITGRIVSLKDMGYQRDGEYSIDIGKKRGIYFVVVEVNGIEYQEKIMKVR